MRQKEPLRALSVQEERELQRVVKATSERVDVVKRAKALLAVRTGQAYTKAAREAGLKSGDSVIPIRMLKVYIDNMREAG